MLQPQELALLYFFKENFQKSRDSIKNRTGAPAPQMQAHGDSSPIRNSPLISPLLRKILTNFINLNRRIIYIQEHLPKWYDLEPNRQAALVSIFLCTVRIL